MKNSILYTLIGILLVALLGFVWFLYSGQREEVPNTVVSSFEDCVLAGNPIVSTTPRQCLTPEGSIFMEETDEGQENGSGDLSDMIVIKTPQTNATISSPVTVSGEARGNWYFEASFPVRIVDANGQVLATAPVQAQGNWMTESFVPFNGQIAFDAPTVETGFVIFEKDNPSGLPENAAHVTVPVKFDQSVEEPETLTVKIYLYNNSLLEEGQDECSTVFPVEREVAYTRGVGTVALEELLKGETPTERNQNYGSSINPGVRLNSLKIENGVAYADFDDTLDRGVGGSCRVTLIRKQITETLKQFPTVSDVVISVEGNVEEALQP